MAVCGSAARQDPRRKSKKWIGRLRLPRSHRRPPPMRRRKSDSRWKGIPQNKFASFRPSTPKSFNLKSGQSIENRPLLNGLRHFHGRQNSANRSQSRSRSRNARVVGHDVSRATTRSMRSSNCGLVSSRSLLAARTQRPLVESSFVSGPLSWESAATGSAACWSLPR
jgi:hypothetical protein